MADNNTPWLASYHRNPAAKMRLFCLPYAGGSAFVYNNWFKSLPPQVEVCPVQLPGRGSRILERPFTRMETLVEAMTAALRPLFNKPFAFFGHSMGAAVSFEVTRRLRREGSALPVHLFISGNRAPQLRTQQTRTYDLPEAAFIEELRRLKGTPAEVLEHPELMEVVTPLLRADFELIETYVAADEPPLDVPMTVYGGILDVDVPREALEAWSAQTTGPFSCRMVPGDHFYLTSNQRLLLPLLAKELYRYVLTS
ncbi:MAG TPA: alpha/beta fold hydrolase [Pyrinomonadaceae bacterium]